MQIRKGFAPCLGFLFSNLILAHAESFRNQNFMKHLGWTERGHVLAGGVMKIGDINGHKELNQAYELGKAVAQGNGL